MADVELQAAESPVSIPQETAGGRAVNLSFLDRVPWWVVLLIIGGIVSFFVIFTNETYLSILRILARGLQLTLFITFVAYFLALVIGLIAGLMRVSKNRVLYTIGTVYVEVVRGIPLLVLLFYVFYVGTPFLTEIVPEGVKPLVRDPVTEAIVALSVGYGAYLAEVYRAGIESIPRGQMEAARSLGLSYFQSMRYVILPQAIRTVLPPLGNDFISMLKDSALASAISVQELTLWTKNRTAATFQPLQHWSIAALLYLVMTLGLSVIVRYLERRFAIPK